MMKNNFLRFAYLLLGGILFVNNSCSDSERFVLNTKEVDYVDKTDSLLSGTKIKIDAFGMNRIVLKDSVLFIHVDNQQTILKIFQYPSLKHIADICQRGRARNEFISPSNMTSQVYYDKGNLIFPFVDEDAHVKEVNITESMKRHSAVVQSISECIDRSEGHFIICNEGINYRFINYDVFFNDMDMKQCHAPKYEYVENGNVKKEIMVYPTLCKTVNPFHIPAVYAGVMAKHPRRNLIIQPLQYMDYILFFDLDNNVNYAIHQSGSPSFNDRIIDLSVQMTFTERAMTDDFFLILYWSGKYSVKTPLHDAFPELLVFDWSGNYLGGAKLDQPLRSIEYDESNKILIGLNPYDDSLYSFNLDNFMRSIGL